jgi:hypothetical protein
MPISQIVTNSIADSAVNTADITNGAVTSAKMASGAARANFGAGAVLQVVSAQFSINETTTSTTLVASSVSASITPSSTSSRIYYSFTFNHQSIGGSAPTGSASAIFRNNSTNLTSNTDSGLSALIYSNSAANIHHEVTLQGVDSPSSTSPVTYTLYHARLADLGTTSSQIRNWGKALVTLMEIAG